MLADDKYFERVDTVIKNAVDEAILVYQPLIEQVSKALRNAIDLPSARQAIEQLQPDPTFKDKFAALILMTMETSEALGRSLVVRRDEALTPKPIVGKIQSDDWFICDDGVVKVSFDIIPEDALKILREKSLTLAGVESDELKGWVKKSIVQAIEQGFTPEEFRAGIDSLFDKYGITRLDPHRIDLIYRMNVFSAYSVAQAQQVAEMSDRFPLAFYSAIHDSRSRHIPLEGYYDVEKVPLPPIDYNCRCTVIYRHVSQVTGNEVVFDEPPRPDLIVFDQRDSF